jgi:hypothetical protein
MLQFSQQQSSIRPLRPRGDRPPPPVVLTVPEHRPPDCRACRMRQAVLVQWIAPLRQFEQAIAIEDAVV